MPDFYLLRNWTCPLLLLILVSSAGQFVFAGKYNPVLNPGDVAPIFKDLPGIDGKSHSADEFKQFDVLVVVFTCNSCPTAVDYEDRMIAAVKHHSAAGKVALVAINPNRVAADQLPQMQARAELKKFNFPYLHDDTQQAAKEFGASYTPEFFVLNKERKVVYMGAMDDHTDADKVKVKFVEEAIVAALAGKTPATAETPARGCAVRFVRDRTKD